MKKLITFLVLAALSVSLVGCAALDTLKKVELPPLPTPRAQETVEETPVPTAEPTPESRLPEHVVVGIRRSVNDCYDPENGSVKILTFSYDTPEVYIEGRAAATEAVNEYIARLDETYVTGNDYGVGTAEGMNILLEMAQDNYTVARENSLDIPLEFASDRSARTERLDAKCLNIVFTNYLYTGGAHGNYGDMAYVFDAESGEVLTLDRLSGDAEGLKAFLAGELERLRTEDRDGYFSERITEDYFYDTTPAQALAELVRDGAWYFDDEGLCVFSSPYEIAPYASGIVEFHIPYAALTGHIDAKWLPEERMGEGKLSVAFAADIENGSTEVIDRVQANENGTELAVLVEGSIYQVTLSRVEYSGSFYETRRLWGCSYMKDCALQIAADIPDGMPNLMLTYLDAAGASHSLLLTQSGEDGSLILMDANEIQAIG